MFIEKKLRAVSPQLLTANGSQYGLVQVASIRGFFAKQQIVLKSSTQPNITLEVKRFESLTSFYVGLKGHIDNRADVSAYIVADGATIEAALQDRPGIIEEQISRASHVEEPILAKRVIAVDDTGEYYSTSNPFPVRLSDGSINIGTVNAELEVQLSHKDNDPDAGDVHDSVRIGNGVYEADVTSDKELKVTDSGVSDDLSVIHDDLEEIKTKLDTLHDDVDEVEPKLDVIHDDLLDVQTKQDISNTFLDSIDDKVSTAANQITEIASLQLIDDVPHAQNSMFVKGIPDMGELDDTGTVLATEDKVAVVRITPQRAKHVNLRNQAGTEIGTATDPVRTDPIGTTTQPVSGTVTANQGTPNSVANSWPTKITDGVEIAEITPLNDFQVVDVPNQTGLSAVLSLTTTFQEGKVGASTMSDRKYVEMQALSNNVKWGYDSTCPFDLFKNQFFSLPAGTNCKVYFKMSVGTGSIAFSEK